MRSFAKLAFAGFAGLAFLKLLFAFLIPTLGMLLGLVLIALKVAVIAAVAYFLYGLIRKREPVGSDGEIVVEPIDADPTSAADRSADDNS